MNVPLLLAAVVLVLLLGVAFGLAAARVSAHRRRAADDAVRFLTPLRALLAPDRRPAPRPPEDR